MEDGAAAFHTNDCAEGTSTVNNVVQARTRWRMTMAAVLTDILASTNDGDAVLAPVADGSILLVTVMAILALAAVMGILAPVAIMEVLAPLQQHGDGVLAPAAVTEARGIGTAAGQGGFSTSGAGQGGIACQTAVMMEVGRMQRQ